MRAENVGDSEHRQPDAGAEWLNPGARMDHNVFGSTVSATSTHGDSFAIGSFHGTLYVGSAQSVPNLVLQLRMDPIEAALAFAQEPRRATRIAALEQLQPSEIRNIVVEMEGGVPTDEIASIVGGLTVERAAAVLGLLKHRLAALLIIRMPARVAYPRMRSLIGHSPRQAIDVIQVLADQPVVQRLGRDQLESGPEAAADILAEILGPQAADLTLSQMPASAATAAVLVHLYDHESSWLSTAFARKPAAVTARHLSTIMRYRFEIALDILDLVGVQHAADILLASPNLEDSAQLLSAMSPAFAIEVLSQLGQAGGNISSRLTPWTAANLIELAPPSVGAGIVASYSPEDRAEVLLLMRPSAAHAVLVVAAPPGWQSLTATLKPGVAGALRRGPGGREPTTGLMRSPWLTAPSAAWGSVQTIFRRAVHDGQSQGVWTAYRAAASSLLWMLRAGYAASDITRGLPPVAIRYRRQRSLFLTLFLMAAVLAVVSVIVEPSSTAPSGSPVGASNSPAQPDGSSSGVTMSTPPSSGSQAVTPAASGKGTNLDAALPLLPFARDWQDVCPKPSRLSPLHDRLIGINCTVQEGTARYAVNVVWFESGSGDPFAKSRPPRSDGKYSMLDGGVPRPWSRSDGRRGTYLTYVNPDGNPSYWLEGSNVPVAVLVFSLSGATLADAANLLATHGYALNQ